MTADRDPKRYIDYLAAKRSIDDRALNRHVWRTLWSQIPSPPLRAVEVGAGIGTMIERLLDQGLLTGGEYVAVDRDPQLLDEAERRLRGWAGDRSIQVRSREKGLDLAAGDGLQIRWLEADVAQDPLEDLEGEWDLVIAHALLDLVDLDRTLPRLLRLLPEQGWFWFTINFDGITRFLPPLDRGLDRRIEALYHETMDTRTTADGLPSGHSQTGRRLLTQLLQQGAHVRAAGASDWVIHPIAGTYRQEDELLLNYMLETVEAALSGHPELDAERFGAWLRARRAQLDRSELGLLAHQIDLCGQRGEAYADPS